MSCSSCRVADAVEHYLDFLSLLQEGLQQQVGKEQVKSSLGNLEDEGWRDPNPLLRAGPRYQLWTAGFSV